MGHTYNGNVSVTGWQCHPRLQLAQPDMNSWMKTPNLPSGVVTPRMKCGDVIEPICLRGLFSVLNINIPNCIKAQHYSRTITSTTTKTIQPKCGQEQLTQPLFGNYITFLCLCSRNLDKVFTLAKQTHFYGVERKRACTIGHHWHMQYCTSIRGHCGAFFLLSLFQFALVNKITAQVVSVPCCTSETWGRRLQSSIPLLLHRLLLAQHYYHHFDYYH